MPIKKHFLKVFRIKHCKIHKETEFTNIVYITYLLPEPHNKYRNVMSFYLISNILHFFFDQSLLGILLDVCMGCCKGNVLPFIFHACVWVQIQRESQYLGEKKIYISLIIIVKHKQIFVLFCFKFIFPVPSFKTLYFSFVEDFCKTCLPLTECNRILKFFYFFLLLQSWEDKWYFHI